MAEPAPAQHLPGGLGSQWLRGIADRVTDRIQPALVLEPVDHCLYGRWCLHGLALPRWGTTHAANRTCQRLVAASLLSATSSSRSSGVAAASGVRPVQASGGQSGRCCASQTAAPASWQINIPPA